MTILLSSSALSVLDKNDGRDVAEAIQDTIPDELWPTNLGGKIGTREILIDQWLRLGT